MKVKRDHRSKFSNLSNWKRPLKQTIRTTSERSQQERHQTKGLIRRTIALHERWKS